MKNDIRKKHKDITHDLLKKMGFEVEIEEVEIFQSPGINIICSDSSLLIGRGGENLKSLQHIIKLLVYKEIDSEKPVRLVVDVGGYRQKQLERLKWSTKSTVQRVLRSGRAEVLRPMNAFERKVVHLELNDHPQVSTESIGVEPNRRILIKLK